DGIRVFHVTGVQTCALPISHPTTGPGRKRARFVTCPRSRGRPLPYPGGDAAGLSPGRLVGESSSEGRGEAGPAMRPTTRTVGLRRATGRAPDLTRRHRLSTAATERKGETRDVTSPQVLKRGVSGVVAAVAVAAMVSIPSPALADPDPTPDTASEALKAYEALKRKAEKLNEAHLRAQDDLEANRKKMRQAKRALAAAQKAEQRARADVAAYRKVVDKFTSAAYRGSRLTSVAAALTGDSVRDYLDRAATIDLLAAEKAAA